MPGRICAVHVPATHHDHVHQRRDRCHRLSRPGHQAYVDDGWIFHGEVTVDKDPQAQAIRTKAQALMFVTKNRATVA